MSAPLTWANNGKAGLGSHVSGLPIWWEEADFGHLTMVLSMVRGCGSPGGDPGQIWGGPPGGSGMGGVT